MVTSSFHRASLFALLAALAACAPSSSDEPTTAGDEQDIESAKVVASYGSGGSASQLLPVTEVSRVFEVAAGKVLLTSCDAVLRLDANGALDPTYGSGGVASLPDHVGCASVAVTPAGEVVAAGAGPWITTTTPPGLDASITIAKLDANGQADASFAAGGTMHVISSELGVKLDGFHPENTQIVADASGDVFVYALPERRIVHVDPTGKVDASFGGPGSGGRLFATPIPQTAVEAHTTFAVSGDRIFVARDTWSDTSIDRVAEVRCFDRTGKRDATFGTNGVAQWPYGMVRFESFTHELLPLAGGGVAVVIGSSGVVTPMAKAQAVRTDVVVAFDAAGALDTSVFGAKAGVSEMRDYADVDGQLAYPDARGVLLYRANSLVMPTKQWEISDASGAFAYDDAGYRASGVGHLQAVGFGDGATYVVAQVAITTADMPLPKNTRRFTVTKLQR